MKLLIVVVFVLVVAALVWRHKRHADPGEQACAVEIGRLLGGNRHAAPQAIADILVAHRVPRSRCPQVGRLVMAQLGRHGLPPEDARIAMIQVKSAYALMPETAD